MDQDDQLTQNEFRAFVVPEMFPHMHFHMIEETLEDLDQDDDGMLTGMNKKELNKKDEDKVKKLLFSLSIIKIENVIKKLAFVIYKLVSRALI